MELTQNYINKVFDNWPELNEIYSTSDNRIFVRRSEADLHTNGKLDADTLPLDDKEIKIWFDDRLH